MSISQVDVNILGRQFTIGTPDEEAEKDLPAGQSWTLMTEETFQQQAQEKKEANSPFAQLQGLFEEDE